MVAAVLNIEIDIKIVHDDALSIEVASRYCTLITLRQHETLRRKENENQRERENGGHSVR